MTYAERARLTTQSCACGVSVTYEAARGGARAYDAETGLPHFCDPAVLWRQNTAFLLEMRSPAVAEPPRGEPRPTPIPAPKFVGGVGVDVAE